MGIFSIAALETDPNSAVAELDQYLANGMPVNITMGDVRESSEDPKIGLLHAICLNALPSNLDLCLSLIDLLFQYGASWMLLDSQNRTPGCICYERGIPELYDRFVRQGVTSEVFLRRMLEDNEEEPQEDPNEEPSEGRRKRQKTDPAEEVPEGNVRHYLRNQLSYSDSKLVTDQNDGVMMDWETPIMELSARLITKPQGTILNVGFGMGIIDTYIQNLSPAKHYIVEAHPAVLTKMRETGWYDKENVVILEGEWKKVLPQLLSKGVVFDGIYYDTFSEHYKDMLEFFDLCCGLLDFGGTLSFFNGLGADKQVCYDVYKNVVEIDLAEYGFGVEYEMIPVNMPENTWDNIKRSYFNVKEYALPKITFKVD